MKARSARFAAAAVLAAAVILFTAWHLTAQSTPGPTPGPSPAPVPMPPFAEYLTFGTVGIVPGQTARLSVLQLPGFQNAPISSCSVQMTFVDSQGKTLKANTLSVLQGQIASLDLDRSEIDSTSGRAQIRGTIQTAFSPPPLSGTAIPVGFGCAVAPTLEVFDDATGVTTVVLESARGVPSIIPLVESTGAAPRP